MVDAVCKAKYLRIVVRTLLLLFSAVVTARFMMFCAVKIDQGYAIKMSLKNSPPDVMVSSYKELVGACSQGQELMSGNLILLRKCVPVLQRAELTIDPRGFVEHPEKCQSYFDYSFKVRPEYDVEGYCEHRKIVQIPNRRKRLLSYPMFIAKTLFVTLPKSVLEAVHG